MNNRKATKRALLTSVMALVMCVVMLVGTTFAWFTDTARTNVNKIQAGNLDVQLLMKGNAGNWVDAENKTLNFLVNGAIPSEGTQILWEPGAEYKLPELKVVNNGNLNLKYKIEITGIKGSAKLNDVIDWTINDAAFNLSEQTLDAKAESAPFTIKGHMKENAGNEYQGLSIDGIGITVYATQAKGEYDSTRNDYDENATYPTGATIVGLNGTYDSLTAAMVAWRESKSILTTGGNMGGHPAELTSVDTISWVISGSVGTGDGAGVVGTSGSLLSGGYIYPGIAINNVYIKGVNNAELINEIGGDYALSSGGKNVVYDGITFPEYVSFNSKAENVTFKNCTFKGGLKVMQAANVTVDNCKFEGNGTKDYAFFAQAVPANSMKAVQFNNNIVSSFMRGLNIEAEGAAVTISSNTIKNITGKTDGFTYGSAIQLTNAKTFTVTSNTISDVAVNALHIYNGCAADSIIINDNTIAAAYLCWNVNYDMRKVASSGNTVSVTNRNQCVTKDGAKPSSFTLN
mgnify:CR=1 FL=1